MWGVISENENGDAVEPPHVVPCEESTGDFWVRDPHILSIQCPCHPEERDGVIVHEEIQ